MTQSLTQKSRAFLAAITSCKTLDDCRELSEALRERHRALTKAAAKSFARGSIVQFASRTGVIVTGKVTKINTKTVEVNSGITRWRVSPSMLTVMPEGTEIGQSVSHVA